MTICDLRDGDPTDPGSDNRKEHGFATGGNSNERGRSPMNMFFSSHGNSALGVQPAPIFFMASTIRNSSNELCRLSSPEVLARLVGATHEAGSMKTNSKTPYEHCRTAGRDTGHANGNGTNAFTRRAEGATTMKLRKYSYDLFRMNSTSLSSGTRRRKALRETRRIACLVGVIVCLVYWSPAQVDRAGLNGTVTDSSGRVLPQTHVTAVQNTTGLRREATSSPTGTYDIPELPVGVYTITFEHEGFKALTFVDVEQVIGRTRTLNATLRVSGGQQQVEVSASSAELDKTSNALGARIEEVQARELPLNGRNWATLSALQPSAVDTGGSNQRSIRFAGRGRDDDNFTYDGIDATNIINQPQQPYVRLAIPLDTIDEFRVDSMLSTAEEGATGGPQLAVTSPSGTNQFHGDVFEFFRNNVFDAQQPVPVTTTPQPPFHLNQFGASLGGPIVRGKTFSLSPTKATARTGVSRWSASSPARRSAPKWPRTPPSLSQFSTLTRKAKLRPAIPISINSPAKARRGFLKIPPWSASTSIFLPLLLHSSASTSIER